MAKQTFTTGQVLTAAQMNSLQSNDFNQTVSVKTAAYTLVAADKGTRIEFNTSGAVTCTVNTGLFDAGDTLIIQNRGAGAVTITAGTATVNTSATLVLSQYDAGTLYFVSASAAIFFNTDAGGGSPLTTKGDIFVYGTGDTRLPVGTNGYTLVADSGETTGLKWAAASSGALVLVKRGTFSNVANTGTTFDDVFTSTYVSYLLNFEFVSASTTANDLEMLLRNTGPTSRTSNYKSASGRLTAGATTSTYYGATNDDFWQLTQDTYGGGYLFFNRTNSSLQGFYYSEANMAWYAIQLQNGAGGGSIGFQLRSSSSNITGQISVYGLAQS